jgi:plastocyanin domain-containing protein
MLNPGSAVVDSPPAVDLTRQDVAAPSSPDELTLAVTNYGYEPSKLSAPANTPITLKLVTQDTTSCAVAFTIPALNYQTLLGPTETQVVTIPAQPAGSSLRFACSMGMFVGTITFQ